MNGVGVYRKLIAMVVVALSGLGVLVATSAVPAVGAAGHVPKGDAFYVPPQPLAKAKPGTIIRSTPIDAPAGARAWKILYHSRAVDGRDIAVSGVVVAPTGHAPRGGRVVVTWAHGGGDLADLCAPSKQPDIASGASGAGIGYPRGSSRCCKHSSTRATWSPPPTTRGSALPACTRSGGRERGAKCARRGPRRTWSEGRRRRSKALVFGLSEGGHSALFAGELAASYAPELHVLGVTAVAPAAPVDQSLSFLGKSVRQTALS